MFFWLSLVGDFFMPQAKGVPTSSFFLFRGTCIRVGLFALPLPGAGVTFFAAAKKVTKESSFFLARSNKCVVTSLQGIGTQFETALNHLPRPLSATSAEPLGSLTPNACSGMRASHALVSTCW
ncbi:hypothetical protein [Caballeronia sp. GAFFF1]|uniref:hypothetical protein n=1 Tax=Caballeronia sp. GAFFF1 TaxID=2921779 RepID=UPI0020285E59|nr:hypothetical protein [Caballeronia sp. GAFFF1]